MSGPGGQHGHVTGSRVERRSLRPAELEDRPAGDGGERFVRVEWKWWKPNTPSTQATPAVLRDSRRAASAPSAAASTPR